ncbi:MAG TPA: energy transducer TonB [Candidatus Acidoferrum sp.]|jgi:protein TonB|nr:energy transducer TonB [Candidatus Acidoferrum sp.]
MNLMDAERLSHGYELSSDLARVGLHATEADPNRKLAWVNSICILVLLIGIVGSSPASVRIKPLPPVEEVTAVLVEPLPPPPQPQSDQQNQEQQNDQEKPDTPQVVVVTPESPAINFSVPTIGNLLVPNAVAKAPPVAPLKPVAPVRNLPAVLNTTGSGGERPQPPYPKIALDQGLQGSVVLRMTVDDAGLVQTIDVAQSSGSPVLDHSALDFVKRRWTVPPGKGPRIYEATINYKLQIE